MKALNIKLATFSFAALLLASCSDSNSDAPNNNNGEKALLVKRSFLLLMQKSWRQESLIITPIFNKSQNKSKY